MITAIRIPTEGLYPLETKEEMIYRNILDYIFLSNDDKDIESTLDYIIPFVRELDIAFCNSLRMNLRELINQYRSDAFVQSRFAITMIVNILTYKLEK